MNLEELKVLCENATPNSWQVRESMVFSLNPMPSIDEGVVEVIAYPICSEVESHNARFIAAARTALPKLMAAVEAVLAIDVDAVEDEVNSDWVIENVWNAGVSSGLRDMHEKITGIINNALEES